MSTPSSAGRSAGHSPSAATPASPGAGAALRAWWQQREPRERAMLVLMCAAIAAFVLWYGVFSPLRRAGEAAQARHVRAAAELARVRAEVDRIALLQAQLPARPADPAALKQAVLATAAQAGLRIGNAREDGGGLEIESESATPAQLFGWLDALRREHGLAPAALSVARNQQRLRVQARFVPPSP